MPPTVRNDLSRYLTVELKIKIMKKFIIVLSILLISIVLDAQKAKTESFSVKIEGEGKPLILIPGLTCSGEVWKETVAKFKSEYECHILTLAGFAGQAPINIEGGYLPKVEKELVNYIRSNFETKPIIVGHSLGGFMALSINQHTVDLVEKIVIVDSFPFYSAAMMPTATEETAKPQAEMMKNMMLNSEQAAFEAQQKMTLQMMIEDSEKVEIALKWSLDSDRATAAAAMCEIMTTDLRKEMESAKAPILVFGSWAAGKDYGITKEMTENIYKTQFEGAESCKISMAETAKHFIMWDEQDWFLEEVTAFLKE